MQGRGTRGETSGVAHACEPCGGVLGVIWLARWPRGGDTCGGMDGRDGQEARTLGSASASPPRPRHHRGRDEPVEGEDWRRTWGACDWAPPFPFPVARGARTHARTRLSPCQRPLALPRQRHASRERASKQQPSGTCLATVRRLVLRFSF